MTEPMDIFLVAPPGLEPALAEEVRALGYVAEVTPGGVSVEGGWPDVWRLNLECRGAGRVLARIANFRAFHLAQLDKRARKVPWADVLRPDVPVRIESTTRKSKIYHGGAATERIARAITEELGAPVADDAPVALKVRIEDNNVQVSVDTSGEGLHKRGHKEWVGKAPMRETMVALLLRMAGFDGRMPVVDPMCGSGTFVLEAAGWAAGQQSGRDRSFAFEQLASVDPQAVAALRRTGGTAPTQFHGFDRDAGAVRGASGNAARAGLAEAVEFTQRAVSDLTPPEGPPGLVICNPPYGARIGNRKPLFALYGTLGQRLSEHFAGWRVGIVTSDAGLARATGLSLGESAPIAHGGLKVRLYTARL
ncbi:class I SAM-dependent RNA methyltransferase [Palleronia sp.]|uniref:THUMP domain-containing class I SAM-dependent RNA methyltransferase n=1 Tax=Palleronia sp. TaxID=1940284 RepID=UPI0035C7CDE6